SELPPTRNEACRGIRASRRVGWMALAAFALVAWAAATPTERVRATVDEIVGILREDADREEKWQRIGAIIDARFDFQSMSQSVLARNWKAATKEEKRQFVEFFS